LQKGRQNLEELTRYKECIHRARELQAEGEKEMQNTNKTLHLTSATDLEQEAEAVRARLESKLAQLKQTVEAQMTMREANTQQNEEVHKEESMDIEGALKKDGQGAQRRQEIDELRQVIESQQQVLKEQKTMYDATAAQFQELDCFVNKLTETYQALATYCSELETCLQACPHCGASLAGLNHGKAENQSSSGSTLDAQDPHN